MLRQSMGFPVFGWVIDSRDQTKQPEYRQGGHILDPLSWGFYCGTRWLWAVEAAAEEGVPKVLDRRHGVDEILLGAFRSLWDPAH